MDIQVVQLISRGLAKHLDFWTESWPQTHKTPLEIIGHELVMSWSLECQESTHIGMVQLNSRRAGPTFGSLAWPQTHNTQLDIRGHELVMSWS